MTGMGSRRQPLMFIITTAGSDIEGPCYDKRRQVVEMLEGTVPDEELFEDVKLFLIKGAKDGDAPASCS